MKYFLALILFYSFSGTAQYNNLKLENGQVYFEKVFTLDSAKIAAVERLLTINIPKTKDVGDFTKASDIITAKIKNALIDYKKYGGTWFNTPACLDLPFFGDVSIIWKDQKYRVTITNMYFKSDKFGIMKCSDEFTKRNRKEWDGSKNTIKSTDYIDKYFTDLFAINRNSVENW
jgi:hypothetical protein